MIAPVVARAQNSRIGALDFVKGALVLFMVLYHWINYFFGAQLSLFKYLRFLTPSFIFITGFLISQVYVRRYDASGRSSKRLAERGAKIFAIFVGLNLLISFLVPSSQNGKILFADLSLQNLISIYLTGNIVIAGVGKAAAFSILLPISYVLLLSAGLILAKRRCPPIFHLACAVFLTCSISLELANISLPILQLVAVGMLGASVGSISIDKINNLTRHGHLVLLAYAGYLIAITIWNVYYPVQIVGVCLTLMLIYVMATQDEQSGLARNHIVLLGQYSLFGYIAQIAILQLIHRSLRNLTASVIVLSISLVAAFVLTSLSVAVMDHARAKSERINKAYKVVFS